MPGPAAQSCRHVAGWFLSLPVRPDAEQAYIVATPIPHRASKLDPRCRYLMHTVIAGRVFTGAPPPRPVTPPQMALSAVLAERQTA